MRTSILLFLCFAALSQATYTIIYTGYTDNYCGKVDNTVTGQIFEQTCAPEFRSAPRSGKITWMDANTLTSCDYADTACSVSQQIICENYTNSICYGSQSVQFSNKYSWVADGSGGWSITYSAYTDQTCVNVNSKMTGPIFYKTCAAEFDITPQSGKITFINDDYLTSCDYSDTSCGTLTLCENYTNSVCYGSSVTSFSNSYSWAKAATMAPTSAPVTTAPTAPATTAAATTATSGAGSDEFDIMYTAYEDNTCSTVDDKMTGPIYAYKCAAEYRKGASSGKIVYINDQYLTSCDYSDLTCSNQVVCENYNNSVCYNSGDAEFSNKYGWTKNSDGSYAITYTSYLAKQCDSSKVNAAETGPIYQGVCALEYTTIPQSGMITYIDKDYLTSCDYSDTQCKNLILCENYNNSQCYGSSTVSFSNKYSWSLKTTSSASSVVSCVLVSVLALALAMF